MDCKKKKKKFKHHPEYNYYFNHWNYSYKNENENENLTEIGKDKTILLISNRNNHFYHSFIGIMNIISTMYIYNLEPEEIQLLFLNNCDLENDIYFSFFNKVISTNKAIYITNLENDKKYFIKKAIHVPSMYDSPYWQEETLPQCKYRSPPFLRLMQLITKNLYIPIFKDSLYLNDTIFKYSKNIKNLENKNYTKFVTIQWRLPFPKSRKNQERLMSNGIELLEILSRKVKNNVLVRLVDTANLSIEEQISLMLETDYFIGIHGAGITLGNFLNENAIVHEISIDSHNNMPLFLCAISGHKVYKDQIRGFKTHKNGEWLYLNEDEFSRVVLSVMKENNF